MAATIQANGPELPAEVIRQIRVRLRANAKLNLAEQSQYCNVYTARFPYVGHMPLAGARLRYMIESEPYGEVGAMEFSAAARRMAAYDRWIGWSAGERAARLQRVAYNSRFWLLPWVQVRILASHVRGRANRRLRSDWEVRYGYVPVRLGSYVESGRHMGVRYLAANSVAAGETQAREEAPPKGQAAIDRRLLSTLDVSDFAAACEEIDSYVQGWMIEVFPCTHKTGCRIEGRQLGTVRRLENRLAIDMIVAARIMHLTWLNRTQPDASAMINFDNDECEALSCFLRRTLIPQRKVPSLRQAMRWVGKLGDHRRREVDGEPGIHSIWEGRGRTHDITATARCFANFSQTP